MSPDRSRTAHSRPYFGHIEERVELDEVVLTGQFLHLARIGQNGHIGWVTTLNEGGEHSVQVGVTLGIDGNAGFGSEGINYGAEGKGIRLSTPPNSEKIDGAGSRGVTLATGNEQGTGSTGGYSQGNRTFQKTATAKPMLGEVFDQLINGVSLLAIKDRHTILL